MLKYLCWEALPVVVIEFEKPCWRSYRDMVLMELQRMDEQWQLWLRDRKVEESVS